MEKGNVKQYRVHPTKLGHRVGQAQSTYGLAHLLNLLLGRYGFSVSRFLVEGPNKQTKDFING